MPVQAMSFMSILMLAQPFLSDAPSMGKIAAPCHIMVDGECKVERRPETSAAGNGGAGGNATVNYNFYLGGAVGGPGGNGGDSRLPPGAPSRSPSATSKPAANVDDAVSYFTWTYNFEPEPGQRIWSRSGSGWSERYPSGRVAKVFNASVGGSVQGCPGQLVSQTADPSFEVFIPHKGCRRMVALFRRDMGAWSMLGPMQDVR